MLPCGLAYSDNSATRTRHGSDHCLEVENSLLLSGSFFVSRVLLWHTFRNELHELTEKSLGGNNTYTRACIRRLFIWNLLKQREANLSGETSLL